jgi:hypothetical protein
MGAASAAVRLLPLDMADAAAVVARLSPLADDITATTVPAPEMPPILKIRPRNGAKHPTDSTLEAFWGPGGSETLAWPVWSGREGPVWSAPALERRAEEHARWEVRLFAS